MANKRRINEDVFFPKREDDGELITKKDDDGELLPQIPSEISDVGDVIRNSYQKKAATLVSKLEKHSRRNT